MQSKRPVEQGKTILQHVTKATAQVTVVIVDCLTDNPVVLSKMYVYRLKTDSKIGTPGCVAHMFDHLAVLGFEGDDDEVVLEALMMADVDVTDVEVEDGKVPFSLHIQSTTKQKLLLKKHLKVLTLK